MNHIQSLYTKFKDTFEHTAHAMRHKFTTVLDTDTITVAKLAEMMQHHPESSVKEQTLLGITYRFYSLTANETTFYMETRAVSEMESIVVNGERILFITITKNGQSFFTYRSYETTLTLHEPIHLESFVEHLVREDQNKKLH